MSRKTAPTTTQTLIGTLLTARQQAIELNEIMSVYLIGLAIKAIEDREAEGVPPGWDDGIDEAGADAEDEPEHPNHQAKRPAA